MRVRAGVSTRMKPIIPQGKRIEVEQSKNFTFKYFKYLEAIMKIKPQ